MILEHPYPICEFDTDRNAVIQAAGILQKTLPEKCVITFFRKELLKLAEERQLPVLGYLYSEVMHSPIYEYTAESGEKICLLLPFMTAPARPPPSRTCAPWAAGGSSSAAGRAPCAGGAGWGRL